MAPPTDKPRLKNLDPERVADDVVRMVQDHIASLTLMLDMGARMPAYEGPDQLRWTVMLLTGYAQRGLAATDWPDSGCAAGAMLDVCTALYSQAGRPGIGAGAIDEELDADDEIGTVLLAAQARIHIVQGDDVPVRELAALASLSTWQVRELGRTGELAVQPGGGGRQQAFVRAKMARRWLSGRGIEGL